MEEEEEEEEEAVASGPGQWVSTLAAHAPTRAHAHIQHARTRPVHDECRRERGFTSTAAGSGSPGQTASNIFRCS